MKKQLELFKDYPRPKTNIQEVLLTLILSGKTTFFDFNYMQGYRTRISELTKKHFLPLETKKATRCNKFGNNYTYHIHILPGREKEKAIKLYKEMQND